MRGMLLITGAWLIGSGAAAQPSDVAPSRLSGNSTFVGPSQTFINPVVLTFDGPLQPGAVSGRVDWRGVSCGAKDEPFTGTWNGVELRIETTHRPGVNTQRTGGQCGTGKAIYVLMRKPNEKRFEGEARLEGTSAVAALSLSP